MTLERWPWDGWDSPVWHLLGGVELTYHPALAIAVLAAVNVFVSPMPALSLQPLAVGVGVDGVSVTRVLEAVVVVDFVGDLVSVYVVAGFTVHSDAEDDDE